MSWKERVTFCQEFYNSNFLLAILAAVYYLNLTQEQLEVQDSRAIYFKIFEKLKSIKYLIQEYCSYSIFDNVFSLISICSRDAKLISYYSNYFNGKDYYNTFEINILKNTYIIIYESYITAY